MQINFKRIIKQLQERDWSQEEIAAYVGCRQGNISAILHKNREPRFFLGMRLCKLYEEEVLGK